MEKSSFWIQNIDSQLISLILHVTRSLIHPPVDASAYYFNSGFIVTYLQLG